MTGYKNCRQSRLLTWTGIIGRFIYPAGRRGMNKVYDRGLYVNQLQDSFNKST